MWPRVGLNRLMEERTMKDFRDLIVWEKAHEIALASYAMTANFPKHEVFGIVAQIRRAASSIGANIAEGCGRGGNAEFQRFLQVAGIRERAGVPLPPCPRPGLSACGGLRGDAAKGS